MSAPNRQWLRLAVLVAIIAAAIGFALVRESRDRIPNPPGAIRPLLPKVARYVEATSSDSSQGRMFCGVRYLGRLVHGSHMSLYVWEACEQFSVVGGVLTLGTGWSAPAVVSVVEVGGRYRIVDERQANDYDEPNFSRMFPSSGVRNAIYKLDGSTSTAQGSPAAMLATDKQRARRDLLHH